MIYAQTYILNNETSVEMNLDIFSQDEILEIRIIKNGIIVETIVPNNSGYFYSTVVSIDDVALGDWIVIEVIADFTAYAITNPIFIG